MPTPNPTVRREYRGSAAQTTLNGGIGSSATSFVINANTNWPTGAVGDFTVTIDRGLATEERILCSAQSSKTVTVATRGYDGTTAQAHANLATVECTLSGVEADEWNQHTNATSGVHGVAGSVVGTTDTQTLTNKTLTSPTINNGTIATPTITNPALSRTLTTALKLDSSGHLAGAGSAPMAAAGAGNGASPPAPTVAAGSTDQAGKVDFGSGTGPGTTPQVVVTFANAFAAAPKVVIAPTTSSLAALQPYVNSTSTTTFQVSVVNAPTSGQAVGTFEFFYLVVG